MRWSQPLPSVSSQAGPNWSRLYPVLGARPLTCSSSAVANADCGAAFVPAAATSTCGASSGAANEAA